MKQVLLILILAGSTTLAFTQSAKLTGTILDSLTKTPMELATISLLDQDSTLIGYKLSDRNGLFAFDKIPLKKELLLNVTYVGYKMYNTRITLERPAGDTLNILMSMNLDDSNAVIVTATIPVRMNGDTLEINPAAFKMRPDAVVEELLNEVPGITIWSDGTITVNGRKVQNLFVDGKPFLGVSDPRFATQNLPKSAIDKIQVYQEYDRSNIGQDNQPKDSILNMNVKLKESSKKGYFGKVDAGYGTRDLFEADLSFQVYNKKSSLGIGGGYNNINKGISNLQELFTNNTYRNFNPNLYNVGSFGASGINKNHSIGGIFTHNFIENSDSRQRNQAIISYNKSGTDSYLTDLKIQDWTTAANPQLIREESEENRKSDRHNLSLNYEKTSGYNDNFKLAGNAGMNTTSGNSSRTVEVRDVKGVLQSTNTSAFLEHSRSQDESLNLTYSKSDMDDPLNRFNIQMNVRNGNYSSERDALSNFDSYLNNDADTSFVRRYNSDNQSFNASGHITYPGIKRLIFGRFAFFGIDLNLNLSFNYNRISTDARVSDYDSSADVYVKNTSLSNFNKKDMLEYAPSLSFSKSFTKWSNGLSRSLHIQASLKNDYKFDRNSSSIAKRNLDRSFQFFRYEGSMNYFLTKSQQFMSSTSLSYSRNFEYPSVDVLYTIVDNINAYEIRVGNPDLKNTIHNRINLYSYFNTQRPKSKHSFSGSLNAGITQMVNPVVDSLINDPAGKRIYYFTNAGESTNTNLNYNISVARRFKKNTINFMYAGSFHRNRRPGYVDGIYTVSQNNILNQQISTTLALRSRFVLNIAWNIQQNSTRQSASSLSAFKNTNYSTKVGATFNGLENFTFSSTFDHIRNSNLEEPTLLWNSFVSYRFLKRQAELKFTAMDMLKQYKNISNYAGPFGTTTSITNGLQQYFLITIAYFPRKFGKTTIQRKEIGMD